MADIAHIAGLVVGGAHESPAAHAHLITTTTHKTLRGPRGALVMATEKGLKKDPELTTKIDKAIIPGLQGGPHMNTIAGIAVALREAAEPTFTAYAAHVKENAAALAEALIGHGFSLVSGGTDNHLIVIDLSPTGIGRGKFLHLALERVGLFTNMNAIPGEQASPLFPSGLRLGTPAATTRGMGPQEMQRVAGWIARVADHISEATYSPDKEIRRATFESFAATLETDPFFAEVAREVRDLCRRFPLPYDAAEDF